MAQFLSEGANKIARDYAILSRDNCRDLRTFFHSGFALIPGLSQNYVTTKFLAVQVINYFYANISIFTTNVGKYVRNDGGLAATLWVDVETA